MVDDDSHFMDESRREVQGRYATLEEAVRVSMSITARGLPDDDEPRYTSSSEDPFILPVPDAAAQGLRRMARRSKCSNAMSHHIAHAQAPFRSS